MKKCLLLLPLLILIGCSKEAVPTEPAVPAVPPETTELAGVTYELEYSDDFNSSDTIYKNWGIINLDFGESRAKNGYHIWAKKENVNVEDGSLCLNVNIDNQNKTASGGTLTSINRFLLKDTMWETRFKVDKSLGGDWFVFLITPKHSPDSTLADNTYYSLTNDVEFREITPIELETEKGKFRSAVYFFNNLNQTGYNLNTEKKVTIDDSFYNTWHTLKFIWNDTEYHCYLDDKFIYQVTKNETLKNIPENELYGTIYFGADMMGEWHGMIDTSMPPHSYYVDYVKVWRKAE